MKFLIEKIVLKLSSIAITCLALSSTLTAANLELASTPLSVATYVEPGVTITMDSSTSMHFQHVYPGWTSNQVNSALGYLANEGQSGYKAGIFDANDVSTLFPSGSPYNASMLNAFRASNFNPMAYNPKITYQPPTDEYGIELPTPTWPTAYRYYYSDMALNDPDNIIDLSTEYVTYIKSDASEDPPVRAKIYDFDADEQKNESPGPAYYYEWKDGVTATAKNTVKDENYNKILVASRPAAERQNFVIWYTYYRTRGHALKTSAIRVMAGLSENLYVATNTIGLGEVNFNPQADPPQWGDNELTLGIAKFAGDHRKAVIDWLNDFLILPINDGIGTDLETPIIRIGDYLKNGTPDDPDIAYKREINGQTEVLSCAPHTQLLFTDGEHNDISTVYPNSLTKDHDGGVVFPDGQSYGPDADIQLYYHQDDFKDMADLAFHYWATDLKPDLDNDVSANYSGDYFDYPGNPATWQHLVNYVITFGVSSQLEYPDDLKDIADGDIEWPLLTQEAYDQGAKAAVDDTYHAAINSRGQYFAVNDPNELIEVLQAAFSGILEKDFATGSAAALGSGAITSFSRAYFGGFDTTNGKGILIAWDVDSNVIDPDIGDLGCILTGTEKDSCDSHMIFDYDLQAYIPKDYGTPNPSPDARNIFTYHNGQKIDFKWNTLPQEIKDKFITANDGNLALANPGDWSSVSEARFGHFIGHRTEETDVGGPFRDRTGILGSIEHSGPKVVGVPRSTFTEFATPDDAPENEPDSLYSKFKIDQKDRKTMLYVGANDGMLHAFDAKTGVEEWAFVAPGTFDVLQTYSRASYSGLGSPSVDGPITVADAFVGGSWKTVLIGGYRNARQGLFALDITNPSAPQILWAIDDLTDYPKFRELGYVYDEVAVTRLSNGKWVALIGNGYNNTDDSNKHEIENNAFSIHGRAGFYMLDLANGDLLAQNFSTPNYIQDPSGQEKPNGFGQFVTSDFDTDGSTEFAFAGSLFGGLYVIDLRDGDNPTMKLLFEPSTNAQNYQPITAKPRIHRGDNITVLYGTGKYIETDDKYSINVPTQSFYGLFFNEDTWNQISEIGKNELLQQELGTTNSGYRTVTSKEINDDHKGWYVDFDLGGDYLGERVVSRASLLRDRVAFTSIIPDDSNPCDPGGRSVVMVLNAGTGGLSEGSPVLDFNKDGNITEADYYEGDDGTAIGIDIDSIAISGGVPITTEGGKQTLLISLAEGENNNSTMELVIPSTSWGRFMSFERRPQ